jgi:hypothetical protein
LTGFDFNWFFSVFHVVLGKGLLGFGDVFQPTGSVEVAALGSAEVGQVLDSFRGEGFWVGADGVGEGAHVFVSFYVYVFFSDNRSLAGATSSGQIKFEFIL